MDATNKLFPPHALTSRCMGEFARPRNIWDTVFGGRFCHHKFHGGFFHGEKTYVIHGRGSGRVSGYRRTNEHTNRWTASSHNAAALLLNILTNSTRT